MKLRITQHSTKFLFGTSTNKKALALQARLKLSHNKGIHFEVSDFHDSHR